MTMPASLAFGRAGRDPILARTTSVSCVFCIWDRALGPHGYRTQTFAVYTCIWAPIRIVRDCKQALRVIGVNLTVLLNRNREIGMPVYSLDGHKPELADEESGWIAPDASVIGKVSLGKDVGI